MTLEYNFFLNQHQQQQQKYYAQKTLKWWHSHEKESNKNLNQKEQMNEWIALENPGWSNLIYMYDMNGSVWSNRSENNV